MLRLTSPALPYSPELGKISKEALVFEVKKFNYRNIERLNPRLFHAVFRIISGNKPSIFR